MIKDFRKHKRTITHLDEELPEFQGFIEKWKLNK
jgi:hypothetical protein